MMQLCMVELGYKRLYHFWIMFVGAIGIVIGLVLYGPRLIKTVGRCEITELDPDESIFL